MGHDVAKLRSVVADAINRVLCGDSAVDAELERIDDAYRVTEGPVCSDKLANDAVHALRHWQIDEDIRDKDSTYAAAQRDGLQKLVARLRGEN